MPKSYMQHERERRVYHADWWSPEKDAQGVYLERVEIVYPQTERDSQWITDAVQQEQRREQKASGGGNQTGRDAVMAASLGGLKNTRMFTLMRMVAELTDETGKSVLPPVSASAQDKMAFWRGVPDADMAYIAERIEDDNTHSVVILRSDEEEAEVKGGDPQEIAENHFRTVGSLGAPE